MRGERPNHHRSVGDKVPSSCNSARRSGQTFGDTQRMHRSLIVFLVVVMVTGCVPAPTIYYKPESTVGRRVDIGYASIAPADGWEIESGKATVRIRVTRHAIHVGVLIPTGSRAIFSKAEIRVISHGREEVLTMTNLAYTEDKSRLSRAVSATAVLEGGTLSFLFGKAEPREYSTWLELSKSLTDGCEVLLPDLSVDGEIHSYGPVRFSKKRGVGIFFING